MKTQIFTCFALKMMKNDIGRIELKCIAKHVNVTGEFKKMHRNFSYQSKYRTFFEKNTFERLPLQHLLGETKCLAVFNGPT